MHREIRDHIEDVLTGSQPDGTAFYDRVGWGRLSTVLAAAKVRPVLSSMTWA